MVDEVSLICPTVGDGHSDKWWGELVMNTDFALLKEIVIVWDSPEGLQEHITCKNFDGKNGGGHGLAVRGGNPNFCEVPIRTLINPSPVGISRAFNMGAAIASGEYLCFLEDRVYVTKGWLTGLKKVLDAHPEYGWAAAYQAENPNARFTSMCSLMRRGVFESIGGFDEQFEVFDDADLVLRLRDKGFDPRGVEDIKVNHPEARTTTGALRGGRGSEQERAHFVEMGRRLLAKWGDRVRDPTVRCGCGQIAHIGVTKKYYDCPTCGQVILNRVVFEWGKMPSCRAGDL